MARKSNVAAKPKAEVVVEQSFPNTEALIASGFTTKSARIRELARLGMKTGAIAKQETNGLYQHAYNVLHRELKGRPAKAAPVSETPVVETDADA